MRQAKRGAEAIATSAETYARSVEGRLSRYREMANTALFEAKRIAARNRHAQGQAAPYGAGDQARRLSAPYQGSATRPAPAWPATGRSCGSCAPALNATPMRWI